MTTRLIRITLILILPLAVSFAQTDFQEYVVALKGGRSISTINQKYGTQTVRQIQGRPIYLVKSGDKEVLEKLKEDKDIDLAEENVHVKLKKDNSAFLDPAMTLEAASSLDGQTLTNFYGTMVLKSYVEQPAVSITRLDEARAWSTGAATRVAYIDTGVDPYHPALRPWLDPGIDLVFGQTPSEVEGLSPQVASGLNQAMTSLLDERFFFLLNQAMASLLDGETDPAEFPSALGHGTLVAGLIHLFAPEARIVPIKAFDAYGNTTMFTIIESIYRARDLGVDVINMSFSVNDSSFLLARAIADAHASGIAIVSSVGNDAMESSAFPASYPMVIGVAATDNSDRLASFSNYGRSVSVAAPGALVVSTVPGGRYAVAWGTSFSAPVVSGTIALIVSGHRGMQASEMSVTMADFIDHLNPGFEKKIGKGRINVQRALMPAN